MKTFINLLTRLHATRLVIAIYILTWPCSKADSTRELLKGFKASPDPSVSKFQPLLSDSTGNFSLGFLRVKKDQLALTVLHVPSFEPLWQANPAHLAHWSSKTQLMFNGSLVISDPSVNLFWTTSTDGDHVVLLNTSNLHVRNSKAILWQSFNSPTDTLVENQNFTSNMTLTSSNGLYTMSLGNDFLGLYAKFKDGSNQIYLKHKALEGRASIIEGKGPLFARVNSDGYLGMYQTSSAPVDVQAFNTFQRPINAFIMVRLETDGNLKGYYWDGSSWVLDYQAISTECELPSACGAYGICSSGKGCSCFDNKTEFRHDQCSSPKSGDFCGSGLLTSQESFTVLKRKGVELPYKELMKYKTTPSLEQCESLCEKNCMCWGAVYNNASGFCYLVDYPIQTLVGTEDDTKWGYFKIKENDHKGKKINARLGVVIGVLSGAVFIIIVFIGFWGCKMWKKKSRGVKRSRLETGSELSPGPYKNLGSDSFGSIEMGNKISSASRAK